MMPPAWLLDILAALMLMIAAVSATRLAIAWWPANRLSAAELTRSRPLPRGPGGADTDIAHLLMGVAMAGMLAPSVKTLPPQAWEAIFDLLTTWFAWHLVGDANLNGLRFLVSGHRAAHLFHCAAMVLMFAALTTSDGICMTGMGSGMARSLKYPVLAFAVVLVCYSVWDLLGRLSGRRYGLGLAPSSGDTAPTAACRIAMGVTTAFMLLAMS
jgi:hypothetical protein